MLGIVNPHGALRTHIGSFLGTTHGGGDALPFSEWPTIRQRHR